jgi:hypothetical protein
MGMAAAGLTRVRKSILPSEGDTWSAIAGRELSALAEEDAVSKLQSWNLHVFMRAAAGMGRAGSTNPILPSDVIFIEPPLAH